MPRKKSGLFDNKVYQNEYHKAMKTKLISFNPKSQEDMLLWEHLQRQENQTGYIKSLILKDMQDKEAFASMKKRSDECAEKLKGLSIPFVDGYRDEEACRIALEQDHTIFVQRSGDWEIRFDVEAKKVLTVRNMNSLRN